MKIYSYIIILFFIISCQNKNGYSNLKENSCVIILNEVNEHFILSDINYNLIKIKNSKNGKVFFSLDPECPLSKSYSITINQLHEKYGDNIDFYGVFTSSVFSQEKTNDFIQKNNITMPLIIDTNQVLTKFLDAKITPECFLLDSKLNVIYRGLIDVWVKELGRKRQYIENHYLDNSLELYLKNKPILIKETDAIGCIIQR